MNVCTTVTELSHNDPESRRDVRLVRPEHEHEVPGIVVRRFLGPPLVVQEGKVVTGLVVRLDRTDLPPGQSRIRGLPRVVLRDHRVQVAEEEEDADETIDHAPNRVDGELILDAQGRDTVLPEGIEDLRATDAAREPEEVGETGDRREQRFHDLPG